MSIVKHYPAKSLFKNAPLRVPFLKPPFNFPAFSIHNIATLCTLLKSPNSPLTSAEQIRYSELTLFMRTFERGLHSYNLVAFIKIHFLASSMNSFVENVLYFSLSALEDPISKFIQINSFSIAHNSFISSLL